MSKYERDTLSRMGVTKKDRKEIYGCLSSMIFFPIYLIADISKIINNKSSNKKNIQKKETEYNVNKKTINESFEKENENFSINKIDNKTILEDKYFKLECWEYNDNYYFFHYELKWNNGSVFGGNLGFNKFNLSIPFNFDNYNKYFEKAFELAKQSYKENYKKDYNFYNNVL